MKKTSIILAHFKTWRWTAVCIHNFKQFGIPVDSEIIVCDNSPGHPSIKCLTETPLGDGIKIVQGNPDFPSHGQAYQKCFESSTGDWIFTAESDSFPIRHGWFDEYVKASAHYDYIGPEMPMGGGTYIHPAGALTRRSLIKDAEKWQDRHKDWVFIPGAGAKLKTADKGYHVVAAKEWLEDLPLVDAAMEKEIELWKNVGVWQEMRCFDEDTFDNYMLRTGIKNWEPVPGKFAYNKIGFEPGQWLSYFAQEKSNDWTIHKAPTHIEWMPGHEGKQAAFSTVFGGFVHAWCGSVSTVSAKNLHPEVAKFKKEQADSWFNKLPEDIRTKIESMEAESV
jgi:hypothetical protein